MKINVPSKFSGFREQRQRRFKHNTMHNACSAPGVLHAATRPVCQCNGTTSDAYRYGIVSPRSHSNILHSRTCCCCWLIQNLQVSWYSLTSSLDYTAMFIWARIFRQLFVIMIRFNLNSSNTSYELKAVIFCLSENFAGAVRSIFIIIITSL